MKGLYIHVPFCAKKCDYCDFYSLKFNKPLADRYVERLNQEISNIDERFDTVYLGGGTPSMLGGKAIADIISSVKLQPNAEITIECNPKGNLRELFIKAATSGVNRVSIGLQSANDDELKFLTRSHNANDVKNTVFAAKEAGINNISLDVMIGLPGQTYKSLKSTLDFCLSLEISHISVYMLSLEQNTPMYSIDSSLLPKDDFVADLYLYVCDTLEQNGLYQYEISNFAKKGLESRHNLIYWNYDEYLGIGAAAHSFWNNKRFFYPCDIEGFISGNNPIDDVEGGGFNEYLMLSLRLCEGLNFKKALRRGFEIDSDLLKRCEKFAKADVMTVDEIGIRLNRKGFLIQNQILSELIV